MNTKSVKLYLSIETNRQTMINKINNGLKNPEVKINKDPEVEEFQKGFLENWNKLENFPPATEDLKGLSGSEKKDKIKALKLQFCEWISSSEAISEGYMYAYEKKEHIRGHIAGAGNSIKSKTKAAIKGIIGSKKVGRNDLCPCGSGIKYKKCCLNKEE